MDALGLWDSVRLQQFMSPSQEQSSTAAVALGVTLQRKNPV